jgi:hypothetical protein
MPSIPVTLVLTGVGNLPLIPFLTAGWVGCEAVHRYLRRQAAHRGTNHAKAQSRARE